MNIIETENKLGESPLWNAMNQTLYWVDIDGYKIKHYHDETGIIEHKMDKKPTCLALIDESKMMVSVQDGIGIYDYRMNSYHYLSKIDDKNVRLNDGKCSKNGILYIGSMCKNDPKQPIGSIYKYQNQCLEEVIPTIGISNGIAFNSENQMYYADSYKKTIFNEYSVPIHSYEHCSPDGATFDVNDQYYSCLWEGYGIDVFQEQIKVDHINLPCKYTTCCCFGGEHMNKLFVSSAYHNSEDNGKIYVLNSDEKGVEEPKFVY